MVKERFWIQLLCLSQASWLIVSERLRIVRVGVVSLLLERRSLF